MAGNMDPYAPEYQARGAHFYFRLLNSADAKPLVCCYSDAFTALTFNDDNCMRGFYVKDESQTRGMVYYWNEATRLHEFARYAIVRAQSDETVGTIEIFNRGRQGAYEDAGVLRVDIASKYETPGALEDILDICYLHFMCAFGLKSMSMKVDPVCTARRRALEAAGYRELKPGEALIWNDWYAATNEELYQSYAARYRQNHLADTAGVNAQQFGHAPERADTGYTFGEDMPAVLEEFARIYGMRRYDDEIVNGEHTCEAYLRTRKAIEVVSDFARHAEEILGAPLVSAYLTGSAAFGSFAHGVSDLDFFMVSPRPLTRADFDAFHALRARYKALANGYYSVLEGEIIELGALGTRDAGKVIYWGTSRDRFADTWTLDGFSLKCLFKKGMLLSGQDVRHEMPIPTTERMLFEARRMLDTAREHGTRGGTGAHNADWLFLLCQTLFYLYTQDVTDKARAARWLLALKPQARYAPALCNALALRKDPSRADSAEYALFFETLGENVSLLADDTETALARAASGEINK